MLQVKRAFANVAASQTDSEIVTAVSGKRIRVLAVFCLAGGTATNLTFQSNAVAISPLLANAVNGGAVMPFCAFGWFQTVAGEALKATTGSGATTGVMVLYSEV